MFHAIAVSVFVFVASTFTEVQPNVPTTATNEMILSKFFISKV
jgi:hypothetical protein